MCDCSSVKSTSFADIQTGIPQCKELQSVLADLPPLQSMFSTAGCLCQEMLLSSSLRLMSHSHQHDSYLTS